MKLEELLSDIESKAKAIDAWEITSDLSSAVERFVIFQAIINTTITLKLVRALRVALEALNGIEACAQSSGPPQQCREFKIASEALDELDAIAEEKL